jgi:hypothetical protein
MAVVKTLLAIELYELTGKELGDLRKRNQSNNFFQDSLPEYCLDDKGQIRSTVDYLQWVEDGEEKFLLFSAWTADKLLEHEMSNVGLESLVENIDFRPLLGDFTKYTEKDLFRLCAAAEYLIVNLCYTRYDDLYHGGYEVEMIVEIEGKLKLYMEHAIK